MSDFGGWFSKDSLDVIRTSGFLAATEGANEITLDHVERAVLNRSHILPFGDEAKKALENSLREALADGGNQIDPEHILSAVRRVKNARD